MISSNDTQQDRTYSRCRMPPRTFLLAPPLLALPKPSPPKGCRHERPYTFDRTALLWSTGMKCGQNVADLP